MTGAAPAKRRRRPTQHHRPIPGGGGGRPLYRRRVARLTARYSSSNQRGEGSSTRIILSKGMPMRRRPIPPIGQSEADTSSAPTGIHQHPACTTTADGRSWQTTETGNGRPLQKVIVRRWVGADTLTSSPYPARRSMIQSQAQVADDRDRLGPGRHPVRHYRQLIEEGRLHRHRSCAVDDGRQPCRRNTK